MRNRFAQTGLIGAGVFALLLLGGVMFVRHTYNQALEPVGTSQKLVLVTVPQGATVQEIADILEQQGLIKKAWGFEWYVRNNGLSNDLKAGTYALNPSLGVAAIADIVAQGVVATDLVTILPGQRIDQVEAALINSGFKPADVKKALKPSAYKNHPALVDKPTSANLEGYLYPESFHKTADTKAEDIVRASLDEMHKRLTPSVRAGIAKRGLSIHEGVILASIVEREVSNAADRPTVAQVFLKRLKEGIRLESDATASYGAFLAGAEPVSGYSSRYNTYQHAGLTPTPISNVTATALKAVASPTKTSYLFFVSGDDGRTHFSKTLQEHEANINKYCTKLCGR